MGKRRKSAESKTIRQRLASRLRELRDRRGLSQAEQARACGLSHVFYGTVERAERSPSLESIEALAKGAGLEAWELLRLDERGRDPTAAERMGERVAALARGASAAKIDQFERLARVFFEDVP